MDVMVAGTLIPGRFHRYVALGDSFTEGVGDPDPARPNGVRGWADRVAETMTARDPEFGYANLAIRGRKLRAILAEQVGPAIALRPDLVTLYAGANDILRPRVDLDDLMREYDDAVARLADTGAQVVLFTAFGARASRFYAPLRGRFAYYNELVREIVDRRGATLVDYWRMSAYDDWGYWDLDRLHMSSAGHALMARQVLDVLGVRHDLPVPPPLDRPVLSRAEQRRANWAWTRTHAGPWVRRRLTGRSSGDGLSPKYPDLTSVEISVAS